MANRGGITLVTKRSVIVNGKKTSVSLEPMFWTATKRLAHAQNRTVSDFISDIDDARDVGNLSSAIRLYVLKRFAPAEYITEEQQAA